MQIANAEPMESRRSVENAKSTDLSGKKVYVKLNGQSPSHFPFYRDFWRFDGLRSGENKTRIEQTKLQTDATSISRAEDVITCVERGGAVRVQRGPQVGDGARPDQRGREPPRGGRRAGGRGRF